jgi:hypothetical protein
LEGRRKREKGLDQERKTRERRNGLPHNELGKTARTGFYLDKSTTTSVTTKIIARSPATDSPSDLQNFSESSTPSIVPPNYFSPVADGNFVSLFVVCSRLFDFHFTVS